MAIDIDKLTIGEVKEIARLANVNGAAQGPSHSFKIGAPVFIRTVAYYYTGRIATITDNDIGLDEAAWVADTRRFSDAMKNGFAKDAEIEPYPDGSRVYVTRASIIDFSEFLKPLPRTQQ